MMHWLDNIQIQIAANYKILWGDLVHCNTVEFLRVFSSVLLGLVILKIGLQFCYMAILNYHSPVFKKPNNQKLYEIYEQALKAFGFRRKFKIRQYRSGPFLAFTVGVLNPAIYISPLILESMDEAEIKALLMHELSHIKRHDNLRVWLLEFVGAALPMLTVVFFGLYFVVSVRNSLYALCGTLLALILFYIVFKRMIGRRREKKCDDMTVALTEDPLSLASSLVKAWEIMRARKKNLTELLSPGNHILKGNSCLERRVRRLVQPKRGWILNTIDQSIHYLIWAFFLLLGLFLIRFHGFGAYENIGIEVFSDQQGCPHIRADPTEKGAPSKRIRTEMIIQD